MDLKEVKIVFRKNSDIFIKQIKKRKENSLLKKIAKNESNISMFKPANDEYYEYSYFEKYLESQIYVWLINENLFDLFRIKNIKFKKPKKNVYIEYEPHFFGLIKKE